MHAIRWIALAIAAMAASIAAPVMAQESAYCIKGCDFAAGRGDCSFATYQQCLASAAGRDAWCAENPYFNARAASPNDRSRLSRRRL